MITASKKLQRSSCDTDSYQNPSRRQEKRSQSERAVHQGEAQTEAEEDGEVGEHQEVEEALVIEEVEEDEEVAVVLLEGEGLIVDEVVVGAAFQEEAVFEDVDRRRLIQLCILTKS